MNRRSKALHASIITAATVSGISTPVNADWWEEISLSGFATATYSQSNDKVQWLPNVDEDGEMGMPPAMPKYASGTDEIGSFRGTGYGVNISSQINDFVNLSSQFTAFAQENDYSVNLDWAFISMQLNDEIALRTGKIKFPVGIVNEYVNVNYANPWIQAPAVIYSTAIYSAQATREAYTGASILYNVEVDDWYYDIDLFGGEVGLEESTLKKSAGITLRANWDDAVLFQASHFSGTMYTHRGNPVFAMMNDQNYASTMLSVKADWNNIMFFYENASVKMDGVVNGVESDMMNSDSWYSTLGYQMGNFLPHFTYQSLKQGDGDENKVSTIGLRWDVASSVAVKFELSKISTVVGTQGIFRGGLFGVESDADVGVPGGNLILPADDVTMFGMSVDVIF